VLAELIGRASVDEQDAPEGLADVQSAIQPPVDLLSSTTTVEQHPFAPPSQQQQQRRQQQAPPPDSFGGGDDLLSLGYAISTGAIVATSVFLFDVSIQYIHDLPDIFSANLHLGGGRATGLALFGYAVPFRCVMPIGAGLLVAWLQSWGFSPALKFLTRAIEGVVDDDKNAGFPKNYGQVSGWRLPGHATSPVHGSHAPSQHPPHRHRCCAHPFTLRSSTCKYPPCWFDNPPLTRTLLARRRCCARQQPLPLRSAQAPLWAPRRPQ
jgi:hypothetical protein